MCHRFSVGFDPILFILAGKEDVHKILDEFEFLPDRTTDYGLSCPWGLKIFHRLIMGKWCLHASCLFFIESSSKLLVTMTGIKAWTSLVSGLWFPWPIYMFFEMRFDLGTLDSGERSLPFRLLVGQTLGLFHTSSVQTAKAQARLRRCAGSPEPSLVAYVISTIISKAGSYTRGDR